MRNLLFYVSLAALMTMLGSMFPILQRAWVKKHLWRFLAFGSGVLLGIAFLHLLPEAFRISGFSTGVGVLAAFVTLFGMENVTMIHTCQEVLEDCPIHFISLAAFAAITLHSMIDGLAIGVGFHQSATLGAVISYGVILHKFSDGVTLASLFVAANYSRMKSLGWALLLALATPIGAIASFRGLGSSATHLVSFLMGVSAGTFLYVGASDILPRIHRVRDAYCVIFLLGGIALVGWMP